MSELYLLNIQPRLWKVITYEEKKDYDNTNKETIVLQNIEFKVENDAKIYTRTIDNNKINQLNSNMKLEQEKRFLEKIRDIFKIYLKYGERSSKKTDELHNFIKNELEKILVGTNYTIKIEQRVKSKNSSGFKNCDVVVYENKNVFAVFPVKFVMSNYKQNKNNYWESLTGEICHLKWANPDLHIIPVNILFGAIPYKKRGGIIDKFENIKYKDSLKITEILKERKLVLDIVNYIVDVEHICKEGEKYDKCPKIISFNEETPYKSFSDIFSKIIR